MFIILEDYQGQFGTGQPITTGNVGASKQHPLGPPSSFDLMRNCTMRPEKEKYYDAEVYCFDHILVLDLDSFLGLRDLQSISRVNKFHDKVVPKISRLLVLDLRPLLEPHFDYENQVAVDTNRVDMGTSLALRSGLDPGRVP